MECNKDEASRSKEIGEKKFRQKDFIGAKKFATKAQSLYPDLDGIQQLLATFDVYISAEKRSYGEADWYGILGVSPRADDETVRRHYRRLALLLHPDKNKSIGAEGAFKHISEAWSLLSDKSKRAAYDQKRNVTAFNQIVPPASGVASATPKSNGNRNFTKTTTPPVKTHKGTTPKGNASSSHAPSQKNNPSTFWTACHRCKMQYEYVRMYVNQNLLCPNCRESFLAIEIPPPAYDCSKSSAPVNHSQKRDNTNTQGKGKDVCGGGRNSSASPNDGSGGFSKKDSSGNTNFKWTPFSRGDGSKASQAATMVQQAYEKVKREREEAQAATKREEKLRRKHQVPKRPGGPSSSGYTKRRKVENPDTIKYARDTVNRSCTGTPCSSGVQQGGSEPDETANANRPSKFHNKIQDLLMERARTEIHKKLNERKSDNMTKSVGQCEENVTGKAIEEGKLNDGAMFNDGKQDGHNNLEPVNVTNGIQAKDLTSGSSCQKSEKEPLECWSIDVPDSDFHGFDKDRTERCFKESHVWALYDSNDGMPRFYAMINKIISLNPLKMQISLLNSKYNELGALNSVGSGFAKTCGDFRMGKHDTINSLNTFSHKVMLAESKQGFIRIFPRKGDVWALYKNWSPEWNELTADEVMHKYDVVEVLEDYDEEVGVTVIPLVKVAGFKTLFHQHLDDRKIRRIPREEIFRFSHRVPSYLHSGQAAPKGCLELDPAATPPELLQVIVDVKEEDIVENDTNAVVEKVEEARETNSAGMCRDSNAPDKEKPENAR